MGWLFQTIGSINADQWAIVATLFVGGLAFCQWFLSFKNETRKRDAELFAWAKEVIARICALEAYCRAIAAERVSTFEIEAIASDLSALTDTGRLFFPNTRGLRAQVLDEVVRAYRAAEIVQADAATATSLLPKLRQTCRQFTILIQGEMSQSLRRRVTKAAKTGDAIGWNPDAWFPELDKVRSEIEAAHPRFHLSAGIIGQGELATMTYDQFVSRLAADFSLVERTAKPSGVAL